MKRWLSGLLLLAVALGVSPSGADEATSPYLAGRLLVASEKLLDSNFIHTVVYLVEHDADGAVGLIINRVIGQGDLNHLLKGFGLTPRADAQPVNLHFGGPVASGGVFILHTPDFEAKGTLKAKGGLRMSGEKSILEAISAGTGPARKKVMIGYAGWGPGQLDKEISRGDWLDAKADDDFVFQAAADAREFWNQARDRAGLTL